MVANEIDAADTCEFALVNLKHEVDAVFRQLNNLWLHGRPEPAVPPIEIEDAGNVSLDACPSVDNTRTKLDLGSEILLANLAVSLEGDAINDRVLDNFYDQGVADSAQIDIGKKTSREQRLQRLVHQLIVPGVPGLDQQVRADRLGFDPFRPFDPDIGNRPSTHLHRRRTANGRLTTRRLL